MTVTLGKASFTICSPFTVKSVIRFDNPVIFPPGWAKLETCPAATGKNYRNLLRHAAGGLHLGGGRCQDHIHFHSHKISRQFGHAINGWSSAVLNNKILAFDPTKLAQSFQERLKDRDRWGSRLE